MPKLDNPKLKQAGLKATLPRVKILALLTHATQHHMSAEDIYHQLRKDGVDVGLATVYRVLTQFAEAGIVTRHRFEGDQSIFELNQGVHHDHLVCVRCGCVEEFVDDIIEERQTMIAQKAGFEMHDHALNIYGLCPKCLKKERA